jgi:peptide/nickel transport system ATP-binding protein
MAVQPGAPAPPELLQVTDLRVHFPIRRGLLRRVVGQVRAVDGVALRLPAGQTLALVGESGCGKTSVGKAILRLLEPTSGRVLFDGVDLGRLSARRLRERRREMQIIFQDPYSSMNPRMSVGRSVEEGLLIQGLEPDASARRRRVRELLGRVGLDPDNAGRYPHELSGGQRQRVCIARALAVGPRLVVCDEPTSALDVSVQAQILNLLDDLQRGMGLAYLFITHNLSVVEYLAHRVAVMYLGRVVEEGEVAEVLGRPAHPYTRSLIAAVPVIDAASRRQVIRLEGDLPSPANPPGGCHFHPRCPEAGEECRQAYPGPTPLSETHQACCYRLR